MLVLTDVTSYSFKFYWAPTGGFRGYFAVLLGAQANAGDATFTASTTAISTESTTNEINGALQAVFAGFDTVEGRVGKYDSMLAITSANLFFPDMVLQYHSLQNGTRPDYYNLDDTFGGSASLRPKPLNASQFVMVDLCASCASELSACHADVVCKDTVLRCVTDQLKRLTVEDAQGNQVCGAYRVDLLEAIASPCLVGINGSSWNPVRRFLLFLRVNHCRVDASNTTDIDEITSVGQRDGSQVMTLPADSASGGFFAMTIATETSTFTFTATLDTLASSIQELAFASTTRVIIDIQDESDPSIVQIRLVYGGALARNPSFYRVDGLVVLDDVPPEWFVECADATSFSLSSLIEMLETSVFDAAYADGSSESVASWKLVNAHECLVGSEKLFRCSIRDVRGNTCTYDNATSPLAQCS